MGVGERQTPARIYSDLTLELRGLDPAIESYTVSVTGASVGELGPVPVSMNQAELEEGLAELEDGGIEDEEDFVAFGRALADRLLPEGEIRTKLTETLRYLGSDDGVRLRLLIREPRLAQIPWEYTHLSLLGRDSPMDFLALNPKVSMVRHEPLPFPHPSVSPRNPNRLRLIAATANAPGYAQLELNKERRLLHKVLTDLPADGASIDWEQFLENPSTDVLRTALLRKADLFHFAGHGEFEQGRGFIVLPSPDRTDAYYLPADELGKLLSAAGVRIAVLGACETGRRDGTSPWAGVAPALIGESIPAVVAMQYKILNDRAIKFARQLYQGLVVGLSVDEAVSWGRLAVYDPNDISASWGIPVLYHRSADGVVFPHLAARPSATADAFRGRMNQMVASNKVAGDAASGNNTFTIVDETSDSGAAYAQFAGSLEAIVRTLNDREGWDDDRLIDLEADLHLPRRRPLGLRGRRPVGLPPSQSAMYDRPRPVFSVLRALENSSHGLLVLEGGAGAGKTVALRHVARRLCERAQHSPTAIIPIYVDLKLLRAEGRPVNDQLIREFILSGLAAGRPQTTAFLRREFNEGLKSGRWFFLFDSFDEIPEVLGATEVNKTVLDYVHAIYQFLSIWSTCRGVVATREFRWPTTMPLPVLRIKGLSEKHKIRFVRKLGLEKSVEQSLVHHMLASPSIYELTETPLLLSLLCEYVASHRSLPSNAHDVFASAIATRYGLDPMENDDLLPGYPLSYGRIRRVAEELAFCMLVEPGLGVGAPMSDILEAMARLNLSTGWDVPVAMEALQDLKLARRDPEEALIRRRSPTFAFTHRRFQDYFATCTIRRSPERVHPRELLTDGRWREIAIMLCQLQGPHVDSMLNEADALLAEALSDMPDIPTARTAFLPTARRTLRSRAFRWPRHALHVLRVLDAGFPPGSAQLSNSLREKANGLLLSAQLDGDMLDRKWAVQVASVASNRVQVGLLKEAFLSNIYWLRDVAFERSAKLERMPSSIGIEIRAFLCECLLDAQLPFRRLAIRARLHRLPDPHPFIAVARDLNIVPFGEIFLFALTALMMAVLGATEFAGFLFYHIIVYGAWISEARSPIRGKGVGIFLVGVLIFFRLLEGWLLVAAAPPGLDLLLLAVAIYMITWTPVVLIRAYLGQRLEAPWLVFPQIVIVDLAIGALPQWLTRRLAPVRRLHKNLHQKSPTVSTLVLTVLITLFSAVAFLPTIRKSLLNVAGFVVIVAFMVGGMVLSFAFLIFALRSIVAAPSDLWRASKGGLRDQILLSRWLRSWPEELEGRQLLDWISQLRTETGFRRLVRHLDRHESLVGESDAIDALSDLSIIIEMTARRRYNNRNVDRAAPREIEWPAFRFHYTREWVGKLQPGSWTLLEKLHDDIGALVQLIERAVAHDDR